MFFRIKQMIANTFNNIKQFNYLIIFQKGFHTSIIIGYEQPYTKLNQKITTLSITEKLYSEKNE